MTEPDLTLLARMNARLSQEVEELKTGGGGGTSGGMEARIAKLEAQMGYVERDLGKLASLPADTASLKSDVSMIKSEIGKLAGLPVEVGKLVEKSAHLATKEDLGNKLRAYLTAFGVLMAIIFGLITAAFKFLPSGGAGG